MRIEVSIPSKALIVLGIAATAGFLCKLCSTVADMFTVEDSQESGNENCNAIGFGVPVNNNYEEE